MKDKIVRTREAIISWALVSSHFDFSVYAMRIRYAIVEYLQTIVERDMVGSGKDIVTPEDLFGLKFIEIPISRCLKNSEDQNYNQVRKALHELNDQSLEVVINDVWQVIRMIQLPKHVKNSGVISFALDKVVFDALLQYTKQYRSLDIKLVMSFDSVYTMRLYEIVAHQRNYICYKILTLRKLFNLEDKYEKNNDFIRKTLEVAKVELDGKSPWSFLYTNVYSGRHIESVLITPVYIEKNDKAKADRKIIKENLDKMDLKKYFMTAYLIKMYEFTTTEISNNWELLVRAESLLTQVEIRQISAQVRETKDLRNPKGRFIDLLKQKCAEKSKALPLAAVPAELIS